MSAKFSNLIPNSWYTFSMIDDNSRDCNGSRLMVIGRVFSDKFGAGFIQVSTEGLSLSGLNTAIGKYYQLTGWTGESACCMVSAGSNMLATIPLPAEFDASVDVIVESTELAPIIRLDQRPEQTVEFDRPIPYVIEFTPDGRMKIGWTTKMRPPVFDQVQKIKPSRVAIEPEADI